MQLEAICLILVAIVLWAGISAKAAAISTPMFFVVAGVLFGGVLHLFGPEVKSAPHQTHRRGDIGLGVVRRRNENALI